MLICLSVHVCIAHSIGNNTEGMHTTQTYKRTRTQTHTRAHTNWERRQVSHIDFRRFRSIHSLIHRDLRYLLLLLLLL